MATAQNTNPLFDDFTTIPFSKIKTEHYMPAIDRGIERARAEIDAIVNNPEAPTFENTIVAYEKTARISTASQAYSLTSSKPTPTTK